MRRSQTISTRPRSSDRLTLEGGDPRILVLTAAVGEGHVAAARALAADLAAERPGASVIVEDILAPIGWLLRTVLRDLYRLSLRRSPWAYGLGYFLFARLRPLRAFGRGGLGLLAGRRLLRLVRVHHPDVVVSTYPAATTVLGQLRRRGRIDVPVYAIITDLAGVVFWAHRGVDLHLVMHECCIPPVEREAGSGSARRVRPLVARRFLEPLPRLEARRRLGLTAEGPLIVVSGGGWAVGDLEGAVRCALTITVAGTTVVVLAGRSEFARSRLEALFGADERVRVLAFTDQMSLLLAAADVLIHTTGGVTCLEALVCHCPIVVYGAAPGHARVIAHTMASLRLAERAKTTQELRSALWRALVGPIPAGGVLPPAMDAASLVLAARPRVGSRSRHRRLAHAALVATAVLLLAGWSLSTDDVYSAVAAELDLQPLTAVTTGRAEVGLIIRAPVRELAAIAHALVRDHARASFALTRANRGVLATLRHAGDDALPELGSGAPTDWLDTIDRLRQEARALGLARPLYYLAPRRGFTLGQYLLARAIGARPIAGAAALGPQNSASEHLLRAGEVVVLSLNLRSGAAVLDALLVRLRHARLAAVSVSELIASTRSRSTAIRARPTEASDAGGHWSG